MENFGLEPTGRQFKEPAATLVELEDGSGLKHTAIAFDERLAGGAPISLDVQLILSFLQYPMVIGLVELSHHDLASGHFAYPTGPIWTLKEMQRTYADLSQVMGLRAGLEVAWLASQILTEAAETGPQQGCFSHGNLSPWRIAVRPDGQVQVIGYGLPQVELMAHRDDPDLPIDADSVRYAPPERLEGRPEDIAADTYALTVIAFEMITGKPLYGGHDVEQIKQQIGLGEGAAILSRPNDLPRKVAKVMARALLFDPDSRLTGKAYTDAIGALLAGKVAGPSLADLVAKVQGGKSKKRRAARLVSTETSAFTPEQLRTISDQDDDVETGDEPRWGKVARGGQEVEEEAPPKRRRRTKATPEAEPEAPSRRRRRAKKAEPEAEAAPARRRKRRSSADDQAEAQVPQRKSRRSVTPAESSAEQEAVTDPQPEPEPEPKPARRTRQKKAAPEPEPEPAPRRRRRKATEEPEAEPAPKRRRKKAAPPPEEEELEDAAPRRRRRKQEPTPADPDDADEDSRGAPVRKRLRRSGSTGTSARRRRKKAEES